VIIAAAAGYLSGGAGRPTAAGLVVPAGGPGGRGGLAYMRRGRAPRDARCSAPLRRARVYAPPHWKRGCAGRQGRLRARCPGRGRRVGRRGP
jgi:hypothetical protein